MRKECFVDGYLLLPSASEAAHYSWHFTRSSPSRGTMLSRIWIWCLSFLLIVVIPGNSTFEDFSGGGGDQTIFLIACACFRLLISMWSSFTIQYHASLQVIYCKRIIKKRTFFFEWTWLYFFLPIFIKAMKFLMFILEVSNVLLWLCRCFLQPEIFYYPRGRR